MVQQRVEEFRTAMVNADTKTLQSLTDDHLSFCHSNGVIQTKGDFLAMIETGSEVFKSIDLVDRTLDCDKDIATERHLFVSDIVIEGELISVKLEVLEVWRKADGDWKLIARQAFKA